MSEGSKDSPGSDNLIFLLKHIFFLPGWAKVSVVVKKRLVPLMCKLCFVGTIDTGELRLKNQCN